MKQILLNETSRSALSRHFYPACEVSLKWQQQLTIFSELLTFLSCRTAVVIESGGLLLSGMVENTPSVHPMWTIVLTYGRWRKKDAAVLS